MSRMFYDTVRTQIFPIGNYFKEEYNTLPSNYVIESCTIKEEELFSFLRESGFSWKWSSGGLYKSKTELENNVYVNSDKKMLIQFNLNFDSNFTYTSDMDIEPIAPYNEFDIRLEETEIALPEGLKPEKDTWYVQIFYASKTKEVLNVIQFFKDHLTPKVKGNSRISLITKDSQGGLTTTEFKLPTKPLDLSLNYGDKFPPVFDSIIKRLNTDQDKGIVLFHGDPGCGKTHLIRYITSMIKSKEVIFIPPYLVESISSPDFIPFLTEHPNSIFLVEDGERVLANRDSGEGSSQGVSSLLNMGDGLLSDCLSAQFICTFNTKLSNIDKALLRKGRLIAEYKFEALPTEDANRLLKHLGKEAVAKAPMTLADIYGADEEQIKTEEKGTATIGFKRY